MLTKRKFPNVKQAIDELREEGESSILFDNGMLDAGEIVRRHVSRFERWIIFNKGTGSCRIETTTREVKLIRLSVKNVIAVHIPAGCGFALNANSRVVYKVLNIKPKS